MKLFSPQNIKHTLSVEVWKFASSLTNSKNTYTPKNYFGIFITWSTVSRFWFVYLLHRHINSRSHKKFPGKFVASGISFRSPRLDSCGLPQHSSLITLSCPSSSCVCCDQFGLYIDPSFAISAALRLFMAYSPRDTLSIPYSSSQDFFSPDSSS